MQAVCIDAGRAVTRDASDEDEYDPEPGWLESRTLRPHGGAPLQSQGFELSRPTILVVTVNASLGAPGGGPGELALDQELDEIGRELVLMAPHHDFELVWKHDVTVDELMRLLNKLKPVAVHFAGHGVAGGAGTAGHGVRDVDAAAGGRGGIVLLDDQRRPLVVPAEALAEMMASAAPSARLLLLNACHTEAQAGVLCTAVDAVITMNGAIRDDAARSFAAAFYRALGHRQPLRVAFDQARATLAGKGYRDDDLPRLRTRDGAGADDLVLAHGRTLEDRRLRDKIRRKERRGCLGCASIAVAMIAAGAALAKFLLADHQAADPRPILEPPASSRLAERDRPGTEPAGAAAPPPPVVPAATAAPGAPDAPPPAPGATEVQHPAWLPPRRPAPRAEHLAGSPATPATPDDTSAQGELDREIVRRYVARHRDSIRRCYELQRMARPTLAGTVMTRFFITPHGRVVSASATGLDPQVAACVTGVIEGIAFPSSRIGMQVSYPFRFVPSEDSGD